MEIGVNFTQVQSVTLLNFPTLVVTIWWTGAIRQADSGATDFGIMKWALVTELEKTFTLVECKIQDAVLLECKVKLCSLGVM